MDIVVAWFSVYGNTEALAREVADVLGPLGKVRPMRLESVQAGDVQADLVVFATPTHGFGVPQQVRPVLARLPLGSLAGAKVAAFDTCFAWWPLSSWTAAPKVLRRMKKLGGTPVAAPGSFHVAATEGPLVQGERERVRAWAEGIRTRLTLPAAPPEKPSTPSPETKPTPRPERRDRP